MGRIQGRVAVITGASRGIGAATAELFVQEGAKVIITDILDAEGQALARTLGAEYRHLDVSKESEWAAFAAWMQQTYGGLEILFNNAGILGFGENLGPQDPEHASLESWHHVHSINLDGIFLGCKYAIQLMKQKGGSIINMSSRSGVVGMPSSAAYASSKAAIRNHTKTVALYCAEQGYNIRCNAVQPAAILTPLWDAMLGTDLKLRAKAEANIAAGIPLGHMGLPMDVAYAVLYLASAESAYVTGTEITLDGGILAGSSASYKPKE